MKLVELTIVVVDIILSAPSDQPEANVSPSRSNFEPRLHKPIS